MFRVFRGYLRFGGEGQGQDDGEVQGEGEPEVDLELAEAAAGIGSGEGFVGGDEGEEGEGGDGGSAAPEGEQAGEEPEGKGGFELDLGEDEPGGVEEALAGAVEDGEFVPLEGGGGEEDKGGECHADTGIDGRSRVGAAGSVHLGLCLQLNRHAIILLGF